LVPISELGLELEAEIRDHPVRAEKGHWFGVAPTDP
jgi:hypothetical protein